MKNLVVTMAFMAAVQAQTPAPPQWQNAMPAQVEWMSIGFVPPGSTSVRLLVTVTTAGVTVMPYVPPAPPQVFAQPTQLVYVRAVSLEARSWCVDPLVRRIVVSVFGYRDGREEANYVPVGSPNMNVWTRPDCATVVSLNRDFDKVDALTGCNQNCEELRMKRWR